MIQSLPFSGLCHCTFALVHDKQRTARALFALWPNSYIYIYIPRHKRSYRSTHRGNTKLRSPFCRRYHGVAVLILARNTWSRSKTTRTLGNQQKLHTLEIHSTRRLFPFIPLWKSRGELCYIWIHRSWTARYCSMQHEVCIHDITNETTRDTSRQHTHPQYKNDFSSYNTRTTEKQRTLQHPRLWWSN